MKIARITDLHADAGWRTFSFLKIESDDGLAGWSEYNECYGSAGLTAVIRKLAEDLIGADPRAVEAISAQLRAQTIAAPGGINQQAIAALENALVDLKARALGIPVYELLGGPIRTTFPLYWSHCGTYLLDPAIAELIGQPAVRTPDDLVALGRRVRESGFNALKTNIFMFDGQGGAPRLHMPGFGRAPGGPEVNADRRVIEALEVQLAALREGAGADADILLDLNFNFRPEGYRKVMAALDGLDLFWFELDNYDAAAMADIRARTQTPVASCESLYHRRQYRPFLEAGAVDVAIVDVPWNGILESLKIAALCDAFEVNCAPHNFYGPLSNLMSAHFCAAIPNFRIMETDPDDVPWKDELVTVPPRIENGRLLLPEGPGWGAEIDEAVVRAHPPRN